MIVNNDLTNLTIESEQLNKNSQFLKTQPILNFHSFTNQNQLPKVFLQTLSEIQCKSHEIKNYVSDAINWTLDKTSPLVSPHSSGAKWFSKGADQWRSLVQTPVLKMF